LTHIDFGHFTSIIVLVGILKKTGVSSKR